MHQEIHMRTHTQSREISEGTWPLLALFLSPPFVFQMHQRMAVQSSKYVPCMTFSLEKGKSLLRVDFQTIVSGLFSVVINKFKSLHVPPEI